MIANLQPYMATKDSGVGWLADMPEHWEVRRLKQVCRFTYGDSLPADLRRDGDIAVFGSNGVVGFHNIANSKAPCIIVGRKGSFGKVNYCRTPVFAIDTTYLVDSRFSAEDIRWLYFLLGWLRLDAITKDSAIPGLDREDAYQRLVPTPPRSEQTTIAHFLDDATRRIQLYIRAKEKLIALLEEQKQAIIHQAVTGQIDVRTGQPFPDYKDSGAEWQQKMPVHWERTRLKAILQPVDRRSITGNETLLSLRRDHGIVIYAEHFSRPPQSESLTGFKLVESGQLVVNRLQANNGLVFCSTLNGLVSPDYSVFDSKIPLKMRFLSEALRTSSVRAYFRRNSTGLGTGTSGFLRLYDDKFLATPISLPPVPEQDLIIDHIDQANANTGAAATRTRHQISLLRKYRNRLIADVVTGKLDVREGATALPEVVSLAKGDAPTSDQENVPAGVAG